MNDERRQYESAEHCKLKVDGDAPQPAAINIEKEEVCNVLR
jgi:hypothetical protein